MGPDDALALLRRLSRDQDLSGEVATVLLERSGGNPLFLEELVRFVQRQAELEPASADRPGVRSDGLQSLPELPDTLRGLLSARMDALEGGEVEVVEDAAVWGPTGSLIVLEEMGRARGSRPSGCRRRSGVWPRRMSWCSPAVTGVFATTSCARWPMGA